MEDPVVSKSHHGGLVSSSLGRTAWKLISCIGAGRRERSSRLWATQSPLGCILCPAGRCGRVTGQGRMGNRIDLISCESRTAWKPVELAGHCVAVVLYPATAGRRGRLDVMKWAGNADRYILWSPGRRGSTGDTNGVKGCSCSYPARAGRRGSLSDAKKASNGGRYIPRATGRCVRPDNLHQVVFPFRNILRSRTAWKCGRLPAGHWLNS